MFKLFSVKIYRSSNIYKFTGSYLALANLADLLISKLESQLKKLLLDNIM